MVDFLKHMTPEARAKIERRNAHMEKETTRLRAMSAEQIVKYAQLCLDNSAGPRDFPPGEPVYDNAVWHLVLPELIRRVAATTAAKKLDDSIIEELQAKLALLVDHKRPYVPEGGSHDCLIHINPALDEHGYPNTNLSSSAIDTSCAPQPEATGRFIAALLNAAPELLRLATLGKIVEEHSSEDGSSDLVEKLDAAGAFAGR